MSGRTYWLQRTLKNDREFQNNSDAEQDIVDQVAEAPSSTRSEFSKVFENLESLFLRGSIEPWQTQYYIQGLQKMCVSKLSSHEGLQHLCELLGYFDLAKMIQRQNLKEYNSDEEDGKLPLEKNPKIDGFVNPRLCPDRWTWLS